MKDFMSIKGTMSSLQIAEVTGKQHAHIMRDIRALIEQGVGQSNFGRTSYIDSQSKIRPCYSLTIKGCLILASGYNALLREKIINRWEELEIATYHTRRPRKFIAPRHRSEQYNQFYEDLTQLITHDDEREIAIQCGVTRAHVHEVLRGRKLGYRVLSDLVTRAKENRRNGVARIIPIFATKEQYNGLMSNLYDMED